MMNEWECKQKYVCGWDLNLKWWGKGVLIGELIIKNNEIKGNGGFKKVEELGESYGRHGIMRDTAPLSNTKHIYSPIPFFY